MEEPKIIVLYLERSLAVFPQILNHCDSISHAERLLGKICVLEALVKP